MFVKQLWEEDELIKFKKANELLLPKNSDF